MREALRLARANVAITEEEFRMRKLIMICALTVLILAVSGAQAAPTLYTNEANFLAAVSGCTAISEGFESSDWEITRPSGLPVP